jgi:hypothetical protein
MKTIILLILWIIFALLGSFATQTHQFSLFIFCAIFTIILSVLLFFRIFNIFLEAISNLLVPKKRYREVNFEEKEEYFRDKATEHITVNHPEYIGLLTKIDKKKIAEEYLESLKKEKSHGKNK